MSNLLNFKKYSESLPPDKPSECSSNAWNELGKIIDKVADDENTLLICNEVDKHFIKNTRCLREISINDNIIENEHMHDPEISDNIWNENTNNNDENLLQITDHDENEVESVIIIKQNLVCFKLA